MIKIQEQLRLGEQRRQEQLLLGEQLPQTQAEKKQNKKEHFLNAPKNTFNLL